MVKLHYSPSALKADHPTCVERVTAQRCEEFKNITSVKNIRISKLLSQCSHLLIKGRFI